MSIEQYNKLFNLVFDSRSYKHLRNKNIFITGGSGFLGKWLIKSIDYLNSTQKLNIIIYMLTRKQKNFINTKKLIFNTKIFPVIGSLNNFILKKVNIDHIFHLSGEVSLISDIKVEDIQGNLESTIKLLNFFKTFNAKSISYLSSGSVYGKHTNKKRGWKEDDINSIKIDDEIATYSLSKKLCENIISHGYEKKSNKTINIFRAFSFGGSGFNKKNNYAFDEFIKNRIQSNNIKLKSKINIFRNYMHPIDLSNWMFLSLKLKGINVINSGAKDNYSLKSLAKKISVFKFKKLPKVSVLENISNSSERYIPNLDKAKKLGLTSKISINMQIEDSMLYHYNNKNE